MTDGRVVCGAVGPDDEGPAASLVVRRGVAGCVGWERRTVAALARPAVSHGQRSRKSELDAIEDEIDAIYCAYLSWLWATDSGRMTVLGDYTTGYIVTPKPAPPAVVPGRPVRRMPPRDQVDPGDSMTGWAAKFRAIVPRLTIQESEALASIVSEGGDLPDGPG